LQQLARKILFVDKEDFIILSLVSIIESRELGENSRHRQKESLISKILLVLSFFFFSFSCLKRKKRKKKKKIVRFLIGKYKCDFFLLFSD